MCVGGGGSSREGDIFGKNAFPDNCFYWPQGQEATLCTLYFYKLIFVNWFTVQFGENQLLKNVSRMARMAGVSPEDPEERMKDEKMPRRGSTAL